MKSNGNSTRRAYDSTLNYKRILLVVIIVLSILSLFIIFDPFNWFNRADSKKIYKIKSGANNRYLEVKDDSTVDLKNKKNDLDQAFTIEELGEKGTYKVIKNVNSLKALEVNYEIDSNNPNEVDDVLVEDSYKKEDEQKFELIKKSQGYYLIKNKKTNKYLTVENDEVIEKDLMEPIKKSQKWYIEETFSPYKTAKEYIRYKYISEGDRDKNRIMEGAKILGLGLNDDHLTDILGEVMDETKPKSDRLYRIRSGYSNLYCKIDSNSLNVAARLLMQKKDDSFGELFRFEPSDDEGHYRIINLNSNLLLDCRHNDSGKNNLINQCYDKNQANQRFKVTLEKNGIYKFKLKNSGQYMTIKNDSKNTGAEVCQWPYKTSGANNQDWYLEPIDYTIKDTESFVNFCVNQKIVTVDRILRSAEACGLKTSKEEVSNLVDKAIRAKGTEIFTEKTGFITTYDMLDKTVDRISFAGAHNAFSNNKDRRSSYVWDTYQTGHDTGTENHDISIGSMLSLGYRVIDLDIGNNGNGKTGSYHRYRLRGYSNQNGTNAIQPKIKRFLDENPSEIVIIHVSDVYNGTIDLTKLRSNSIYHKGEEAYNNMFKNFTTDMKNTGLLKMCYNFSGEMTGDLYSKIKVPGKDIPWPSLKDMLKSDKRVLLLERDESIGVDIPFKNQNGDPNNTNKDNLNLSSAFLNDLKDKNKNKIINITFAEDWGAAAGDKNAAKINNNGRKIFEINEKVDSILKDNDIKKVVNVVYVDYATGNSKQGGFEEVSPVDAVNKENYKNFGYTWNQNSVGKWFW